MPYLYVNLSESPIDTISIFTAACTRDYTLQRQNRAVHRNHVLKQVNIVYYDILAYNQGIFPYLYYNDIIRIINNISTQVQ